MGDRTALTEFWEQQAGAPTLETMMLNKAAQTVDEKDKKDVVAGLPPLDGMRIVEMGAGIGRLTPILASKAKHVVATDIIESFIEVNRQRYEHMGNITFKTCGASNMNADNNSMDLLFTNWLLMYLTDSEVIDLLANSLNWLCVDGYLHIRESCSEPSKRNAVVNMNGILSDTNPTHYRHVTQYLNLLNAVSVYDENKNFYYKFKILWAKSVWAYVETFGNWRQIQILVKKVVAPADAVKQSLIGNKPALLKVINDDTLREQLKFDKALIVAMNLWKYRTPFSKIMLKAIKRTSVDFENLQFMMNIVVDSNFSVSPFELAEEFNCCVIGVETCAYAYNNMLAGAVAQQDLRVRLHWLDGVDSDDDWSLFIQNCGLLVGCRLTKRVKSLKRFGDNIKKYLHPAGSLILIEEASSEESLQKDLSEADLKIKRAKIIDVTSETKRELLQAAELCFEKLPKQSSLYREMAENSSKWFIVEVSC